ncbi:MAG TPA: hypothetical protein VHM67_08150 [Gemmatimonadaceae bacterium]|nr:hypothetical protein [Gemmatimonadaceae bacterium]
MKRLRLAVVAAAAVLGAAAFGPMPAPSSYKVIVNAQNPVTSLPRAKVAKLFLRRATWPSGAAVQPCDLPEKSPVRVEFTKVVHGKSVIAVKSFWQQQIFAGRDVPPPEKTADAEVIAFVLANPGAIAYVSAPTPLPNGVRAIEVTD